MWQWNRLVHDGRELIQEAVCGATTVMTAQGRVSIQQRSAPFGVKRLFFHECRQLGSTRPKNYNRIFFLLHKFNMHKYKKYVSERRINFFKTEQNIIQFIRIIINYVKIFKI